MIRSLLVLVCVVFAVRNSGANDQDLSENSIEESFEGVQNNNERFVSYDGRIVNGTKAQLGQFPYQVSLRRTYNLVHFCGGSIIAPSTILTAGHCLFVAKQALIPPWTIMVVAGEIHVSFDIDDIPPSHRREVSSFTLHEKYQMQTYENDIALLHLEAPFDFDSTIHAVPLNLYSPFVGSYCQVAGWGLTEYSQEESHVNDLMFVELPILRKKTCRATWPQMFDGQFCAGFLEGNKDACKGDSGGGFVCHGKLTGIISTGRGCAWENLPGLYTSVKYYRSWIMDHMNPEEDSRLVDYMPEDDRFTQYLIQSLSTILDAYKMVMSSLNFLM